MIGDFGEYWEEVKRCEGLGMVLVVYCRLFKK
jgi:hypothetical protein